MKKNYLLLISLVILIALLIACSPQKSSSLASETVKSKTTAEHVENEAVYKDGWNNSGEAETAISGAVKQNTCSTTWVGSNNNPVTEQADSSSCKESTSYKTSATSGKTDSEYITSSVTSVKTKWYEDPDWGNLG